MQGAEGAAQELLQQHRLPKEGIKEPWLQGAVWDWLWRQQKTPIQRPVKLRGVTKSPARSVSLTDFPLQTLPTRPQPAAMSGASREPALCGNGTRAPGTRRWKLWRDERAGNARKRKRLLGTSLFSSHTSSGAAMETEGEWAEGSCWRARPSVPQPLRWRRSKTEVKSGMGSAFPCTGFPTGLSFLNNFVFFKSWMCYSFSQTLPPSAKKGIKLSCSHCQSDTYAGLGKGDCRDRNRARRHPCRREGQPQAGSAPTQEASGQHRTVPSRPLTPHSGAVHLPGAAWPVAGEPGLSPCHITRVDAASLPAISPLVRRQKGDTNKRLLVAIPIYTRPRHYLWWYFYRITMKNNFFFFS